MYLTDLGRMPIIDDSYANRLAEQAADEGFGRGYIKRDYSRFHEGFYAPRYSGPVYPRNQWDDLSKRQDDNESSPDHWRLKAEQPILDQNGYGYCWAYGTVAAVMTAYAQTGMKIPHLSATSVAAIAKNWRDQGGWAGEAIAQIQKDGIAELNVWPEHSVDRSLPGRSAVQESMKKHDVVEFLELPSQQFEIAMSVLLCPKNPRPITLGLMWWGHLVEGVKAVRIDRNTWGIKIVNSWKRSWGENGCAVLVESKATAHEYVAVDRVKLRRAA